MTIDKGISNEKLQYNIKREAAIVSAWSSRKINKFDYVKGEEILPSNQYQIIQQAKFNPFEKYLKIEPRQSKIMEINKPKQLEIKQNQLKYKDMRI